MDNFLAETGGLGSTKVIDLERKPGDASKHLHRYTWTLAMLCSTVYAFGMTLEVSPVFIYKCFDDNTSMDGSDVPAKLSFRLVGQNHHPMRDGIKGVSGVLLSAKAVPSRNSGSFGC
ncbi:hypothetical protein DUI87_08134 [Hirundo rustica rustica]|uniref:Uncharacterized protein n=1 Tax=Hirundo rustica rustica TaxID=333673 RepID=A0A3M0KRN3_HIRRU|nr:hypothetical protein DUI87_08134 [Hirundo rustica rustica]